jgi:dethiobiotin synthetase
VRARAQFIVVGGTDTGVGKTFVAAAVARALVESGRKTIAVKPVESGCGGASPEDGAVLAAATGQAHPSEAMVRLREPLAPALAAEREGIEVDLGALVRTIRDLGDGADFVLVEGAGGLLSPITWSEDLTHLAEGLGARLLLVGSDRIGILSHTLTAVRAALGANVAPLGIVLSAPASPDASTGTNAAALRRLLAGHRSLAGRICALPRASGAHLSAEALACVLEWLDDP